MIMRDAVILGANDGLIYYQTYDSQNAHLGRITVVSKGYPRQILWKGFNASFTCHKDRTITWYI